MSITAQHQAIGDALDALRRLIDSEATQLPFTTIGGTIFAHDNPIARVEDTTTYTIRDDHPALGTARSLIDVHGLMPAGMSCHETIAQAARMAHIEQAAQTIDALIAAFLTTVQKALAPILPGHTTLIRWAISVHDRRGEDPHGMGLVFAPLDDKALFDAPVYAMPGTTSWDHQRLRVQQLPGMLPAPSDAPFWRVFMREHAFVWKQSNLYQATSADEATKLCAIFQWPQLLEDWSNTSVWAAQQPAHPLAMLQQGADMPV